MIPKKLKEGDTIGFVSPSSATDKEKQPLIDNTVKILEDMGLKSVFEENTKVIDKYGISCGTAKERAESINKFFKNQEINAIWCLQGGDTVNEILPYLDYKTIKQNPKIFMGFSDNTVLLNAIYKKTGLITFQAPDAKAGSEDAHFDSKYSQTEFKERLMNANKEIDAKYKVIREGDAKGKIIGANLNCFLKLAGTEYAPDFKDTIILIEGYRMEVRRALHLIAQLKQQKDFNKVKGVVIGDVFGFDTEEKQDTNGNRLYFEEIFKELTEEYNFPILKTHSFGHRCPCTTTPIGVQGEIKDGKLIITEEFIE
jgi:muramoyltetrapeptide carboxypeptidase